MSEVTSHKRIAKNTLALYIRGLISVAIGLYTSRVVIDTLGVDDYGVYGVAGGFVGMLSFINASMTGASSRFITYEIGLGDHERTKKTFANALLVHIVIALFIGVICEAVGVWFLNTKLNIPLHSKVAANWVFQLSVLTTMVSITQVPYSALVISYEKMGIYAYMEVINVILKLLIVYFLLVLPGNKLIIYAILTAIVAIGIAMAYRIYCLKQFEVSHTGPHYDKPILKPMLSFSGLDMYGNLCVTAKNQGTTFLLNIFFGVAINGAASIVNVINGTISGFASNITTAFRPQIIKNYAQKSWHDFQNLIIQSSQFSAILLIVMAIPLILETPYIFGLWLGEVPEYVVIFCRITILTAIISQINNVTCIGIHATGNMKMISFITGSITVLSLPVIYIFLKFNYNPPSVFYILLIFSFFIWLSNILILKHNVKKLKLLKYIKNIFLIPLVAIPAITCCWFIFINMHPSFFRLLLICLVSITIISIDTFIIILNSTQRKSILIYLIHRLGIKKNL